VLRTGSLPPEFPSSEQANSLNFRLGPVRPSWTPLRGAGRSRLRGTAARSSCRILGGRFLSWCAAQHAPVFAALSPNVPGCPSDIQKASAGTFLAAAPIGNCARWLKKTRHMFQARRCVSSLALPPPHGAELARHPPALRTEEFRSSLKVWRQFPAPLCTKSRQKAG
jgi:hypothetical protein